MKSNLVEHCVGSVNPLVYTINTRIVSNNGKTTIFQKTNDGFFFGPSMIILSYPIDSIRFSPINPFIVLALTAVPFSKYGIDIMNYLIIINKYFA